MSAILIYEVVWGQERRPDHLTYNGFDGLGMSNFDHQVDEGLAQALTETPIFASYSGWNFHGYVWFEDRQFHCEVWTYNAYRGTVSAATLEEIMEAVSDHYGYD